MIIEAPKLLADSLRLLHPSVPLGFWSHSKHLLPIPHSHCTDMFGLQAQLQSCTAPLAGDGLAPESWPRGIQQITFLQLVPNIIQTQLFRQTQIAHPINTEGLIPGRLSGWGKTRERDSHKGPLSAGLGWLAETSLHSWGFLRSGPETQHQGSGICFHRDTRSLCRYIRFLQRTARRKSTWARVPLWAHRPHLQLSVWVRGQLAAEMS